MRLTAPRGCSRVPLLACIGGRGWLCLAAWLGLTIVSLGQTPAPVAPVSAPRERAARFLRGRTGVDGAPAAAALDAARQQHAAMARMQAAGGNASLTASWQAVGPRQVLSAAYGDVTGRVSAIAIDPSDATGNTVYLGTTGGGVWKSTNAEAAAAQVTFVPLTDTLPVFSPNSGTMALPSLSIGAVAVQPGVQNPVVLAGTGDPNDAADSYYGSGLLRSADGGATWTLIQQSSDGGLAGAPSFVGLSVAGFAWSSATPTLAVAAISDSHEGVQVSAPDPNTSVRGLYYSTDAGVTWKMSVIMDGAQTVQSPQSIGAGGNAATSVAWNPVRHRFYAAVRYHGYYESTDGATWTRLASQPGPTLTTTNCPTNPNSTGSSGCPIFRGVVAVQPVTGDTFALFVDDGNVDQGLWQDVCSLSGSACGGSVDFATQLTSTPLETGTGSVIPQADYNLSLAAASVGGATPDTLLFVGTADLYRCSLNAGCTLRNTTNATNSCATPAGVAGAEHAIATLATTSLPILFVGNDGGIWRSTDGVNQQASVCSADDATHFQNLNQGLGSLAEVISFAQHPTDPATLLVGLGANGSASSAGSGPNTAWGQLSAGEGGAVAIDPVNPQNWYISTAAGVSIVHCGIGTACNAGSFAVPPTIGLPQVANDVSLQIDTPFLLDPALPADMVIGTCRVWRGPAADASTWSGANAISPMLSGPQTASCTTNPVIRSLAAGGPPSGVAASQNAGSTVLYAGMAGALDGGGVVGGHVFVNSASGSANGSTPWTDRTATGFNTDGYDLSSLATDPHDATGNTVYATVMGFTGAIVYRSTDAGAHCTNISANLPKAPANGVVVDPNDANTVYVALDTGVYVTQQVTTCAAANCWSVYGTGLPNAPVVSLAAAAAMQTGDGRQGELRVATYGRGIWQLPLLTATQSAEPVIGLSPTTLTFPTEGIGTASPPQSIILTNTGNAPLLVSSVVTTVDFNQTNDCTGGPIAANATCTIQVTFLPGGNALGTRTGTLTVYGNVVGGQATAALSGQAAAPSTIVLTPVNLNFPATAVGSASMAMNVTIANTGVSNATLQSTTVSGDFSISTGIPTSTCTGAIGPQGSCTVPILFKPTASGTRTGTLTVVDSAGTQTTYLSGTGVEAATDALSPLSLIFAPQQLNTVSKAQQVTLTNSGGSVLTLISAQITAGEFTVVNNCGASLIAHASCALSVQYAPKSVGGISGTLTVTDQFKTQTVALSGSGLAPPGVSLAPSTGLTFAPLAVGITSPPQTVTLTNNGGVPLAVTSFSVPGPHFAIVVGSNTCPAVVVPGASCTLQIAFSPGVGGPLTGTLTVTDSAASSPQVMNLAGTGVDFTLTTTNPSITVASGTSAVYSLLLTSVSGVPGMAALTCSGAPAHATCLVVPATVPLGGGTATVTVTIATGVAALALPRTFWYAWLLPAGLGLLGWRRRGSLPGGLLALCLLCGLLAGAGCGSSRTIPATTPPTTPGNPTPTPTGTSNIVVTASSAGLLRTQDLILIVK